jgi:hypothetical protein
LPVDVSERETADELGIWRATRRLPDDGSNSAALVAALLVLLDPLPARVPLIRPAYGTEPALRSEREGVSRELAVGERPSGAKPVWSSQARQQEAVDAVGHGPREHLGERFWIAPVGTSERIEIPRAVPLVDDRRQIAVPNEKIDLSSGRGAGSGQQDQPYEATRSTQASASNLRARR